MTRTELPSLCCSWVVLVLSMTTPTSSALSNNCVLRPEACKLASISAPVVHRYSDRWCMWFHGRSEEPKEALPPISSGRIYVAESEDGLQWTVLGQVLKENDNEWWSFDSAHVGLGDVTPYDAATNEREAYRWFDVPSTARPKALYFFGGARGDTELRSIGVDRDGNVPSMDLRIGFAVSQGDISKFARVEGAYPTGEILTIGDDHWDTSYVGWPAVFDDVVFSEGGGGGSDKKKKKAYTRYVTYQALDRASQRHAVGIARGREGNPIAFEKLSTDHPSFVGDLASFAKNGVSRRCLRPSVEEKGSFDMWFEGLSEDGTHSIGLARSEYTKEQGPDFTHWSIHDAPVFTPSDDADAWDSGTVSAPFVCRVDDATLRMYYAGGQKKLDDSASSLAPMPLAIGVAESDDNGLTWTRIDVDVDVVSGGKKAV